MRGRDFTVSILGKELQELQGGEGVQELCTDAKCNGE
jgi:hypothetical protein